VCCDLRVLADLKCILQESFGPPSPLIVCSFRPVSVHPEFAQSLLGLSNSEEERGLSNDIWAE